jgi:hypothetical protein
MRRISHVLAGAKGCEVCSREALGHDHLLIRA